MRAATSRRGSAKFGIRSMVICLIMILSFWIGVSFWWVISNSSSSSPPPPKLETFIVPEQKKNIPEDSLDSVLTTLRYWHLPMAEENSGSFRVPDSLDRYVLFVSDCGGFNNIRMAFEYFYMTAWLTKRTLVLPPPDAWYLVDFGPMAVMKPEASDDDVTDYAEFFDLEHMRAGVSVISASDFRKRESTLLPDWLMEADFSKKSGRKKYYEFVAQTRDHPPLAWCPLSTIIYFPSVVNVEHAYASRGGVPSELQHHRRIVEYTPELYKARYMSFPSCMKGDWEANDMRFLGQMDKVVVFEDDTMKRAFKRTLRDHVHFPDVAFQIAARVIHAMGLFQYSALHVRRNELQYKEVFMSAGKTLENINSLLKPKEVLYIATDETDPGFFAAMEKDHIVYRWDDFFTAKGKNALTKVKISRKLIGCIEQIICSGGRMFAGTLESTFTSYIFRLRGYIDSPNTEIYFHTLQYSGNLLDDRAITWQKKPEKGQIYQSEHRPIWEDLKFEPEEKIVW